MPPGPSGAKPAPIESRARLAALQSLATLLDSGIDNDQAFMIASRELPSESARRLNTAGRDIPALTRLLNAGVVRPSERHVAEALNETGRLDRGLALLAGRLEARLRMRDQIKARLAMPVAVLVLALLIAPLPRLVSGDLGFFGYLWSAFLPLLLLAALAWLGWRFWPQLEPVLAKINPWRDGLGWRCSLLRELGHLLDAGVDAERAINLLAEVQHPPLSDSLQAAGNGVRQGQPVARSLVEAQLIGRAQDFPLLDSGEQSGRLSQMMLHRADQLEEQVNRRGEMMAEWLPRLFYALVIGYMAYSLLGGSLSTIIDPTKRESFEVLDEG